MENHDHEHDHEDEEELSLKSWLISLSLFLVLGLVDHFLDLKAILTNAIPGSMGTILYIALWLALYIYVSYEVLIGAIKGIIHKEPFDELLLMSVASLGAFCIGEFSEAIAVILFYQLGEYFCSLGEEKSKKNLESLLALQPENANIIRADGKSEVVSASSLKQGDVILIMAGERIPADATVLEGQTFLDTSSLTGESKPQKVEKGAKLLSGSMNISGAIKATVDKPSSESTAARIMALVSDASKTGSEREKFISRFARIYTPTVVLGALALFVVMGAFTGLWSLWFTRALNFLVISCPCALVISVPLTYFMGMGSASKKGVLIKGAIHIEDLEKIKTVCFDKTGTLTKEMLNVIKFIPEERETELLTLALKGEAHSKHPIALSIQRACTERGIENMGAYNNIEEIAGKGVIVKDNDDTILLGNTKLLKDYGINEVETDEVNTIVNVAKNGILLGKIVIGDEIKEEAPSVINALKKMNIKTIMLTGDREKSAKSVATELNLDSYKAALLPLDKVNEVENLKGKDGKVAFIGDGINDAAVLLQSDVGISMGGISSDAAIESSSVVLVNPSLKGLITAINGAKKTMAIVKENIIFSLAVKLLIMIFSIFGIGGMWLAIFGDVGLAILTILNALRV